MTEASSNLAPILDYEERRAAVGVRLTKIPAVACTLQLVLAYEWLVSGLNKIGNAHFDSQLVSVLQQSTQGSRYGWYASFLQRLVLPNHTLFALLVQVTEPAIGIGLLLGGGLGIPRPRARVAVLGALAASAALLGSAMLSLNYFFQGNCPIPWINPGSSFVPGVDINILVALISLVLFVTNVRLLYQWRSELITWRSHE